jgi:hypothetical protein
MNLLRFHKLKLFWFAALLLALLPAWGQVRYPVTVSGYQVRPSLFLDDYTLAGTRNMSAALVLNDLSEAEGRQVFLRFGIESSAVRIQARQGWFPQETVTLYPGEVLSLNDADFFPWFNNDVWALQGVSRKALEDGVRLPDGFYRFTLEVCDARSGQAISNRAVFNTRIEQYAPPVIFYPSPRPLRQSEILVRPQAGNIMFQWQMNAPEVNMSNTEYRLELYEVPAAEKNPKASVENRTARMVFESDAVSALNYQYTRSDYPLDVGKRYAFRVVASDRQGRDVFRNQGISETAFFYYGYPEGGNVPLTYPDDSASLTYTSFKRLEWNAADNLIDDEPVRYNLRVAPLDDSRNPADALLNSAWIDHSTGEAVDTYGKIYDFIDPLGSAARFAWQVTAHSGEQTVAKSPVRVFTGPPVIPYFYAGSHEVVIIKTENSDKAHLTGEGEVRITASGQKHRVKFHDISVVNNSGLPVLYSGTIVNKLENFASFALNPSTEENGRAMFVPDSFRLSREGLYLKGVIEWTYPFAVDSEEKPVVRTTPKWYSYNDYTVSGTGNVNSQSDFRLLDPLNFRMKLHETSEVRILGNRYTFLLDGYVETPAPVQGNREERYSLHFSDLPQLYYNEIGDYRSSNLVHLIPRYTELYLAPYVWTLDLSDTQSAGKMSGQPDWKGIYVDEFDVQYAPQVDAFRQIRMARLASTHRRTDEDSTVCMIDSRGLQMRYSTGFADTDTAFYNTFPSSLASLHLDIRNSTIREGHLRGGIYIPVISQTRVFPWTVSITPAGFQTGYLDEDLAGLRFAYNEDGGEQLMYITIRRAVFEQRERISMDVDMEWPHIGVSFSGLPYFRTWGDYSIGFVEKGGTMPLTEQKTGNVNGFEINIESIGCGRQANLYAIGLSTFMVMGEDVAGPEGPARSNFYSVSENSLLSGAWAVSGTRYENVLRSDSGESGITGGDLGEKQDTAEEDAYYAQLNTYYESVDHAYADIDAVISSRDTAALEHEEAIELSSVQWQITPPDDMPEMLDIRTVTMDDVLKLLKLVDALSTFLNEDQLATYRQIKESIALAQQQRDDITDMVRRLLNIKQTAINAVFERYEKEKVRLLAPVTEQVAKLKSTVHSGLEQATDKAGQLVDRLVDPSMDGIKKVALEAAGKCPPQLNATELVTKAVETARGEVKEGVKTSIRTSIDKNILHQVDYLCDTLIAGTLNQTVDLALRSQIEKLVAGDISSISLSATGNEIGDLMDDRLGELKVMFSVDNLTATLGNTAKDAVSGIDWGAIGARVVEGMLDNAYGVATGYVDKKVEDTYNRFVEDVLGGDETVAGQFAAAIPINFDNFADNLIHGRVDKIIAFAPVTITVKSKIADFKGYVNFQKDDPQWGDVWMATLEASVKIKPNFSANATYINGTAPEGYKYWFLDIGVRGLNIPVGPTGLAFEGASGRVYHHMSRPPENTFKFDNKVDLNRVVYKPDQTNKFGIGIVAYFTDSKGTGDMILFDCGLEAAFYDDGFEMTMNGNIYIANRISDGKASSSLIVGSGYMQFSTIENSFVGRFSAEVNVAKVVCAGGEMGVSFSPGKWEVYLGKRATPIYVSLLCMQNPQLYGWFEINQSFVDLGLVADLGLDLNSPWIGVAGFKARAWAKFAFKFGADAKVSWKPIRVNRAHIFAEMYAGVGIDYKLLVKSGSFTIASVHLGGDLLFISEPEDIPAENIKAESSISGKLFGKVTVIGCGFGFNLEMHRNI